MQIEELGNRFEMIGDVIVGADMRLFSAKDTTNGHTVAIRELIPSDNDPKFSERLAEDMEAISKFRSGLIPKLVGVFSDLGNYYVARNFPGGVGLNDYRSEHEDKVLAHAQEWINQLMEELEKMHGLDTPYVLGKFGPEDLLISPSLTMHMYPINNKVLTPPDLLEDLVPGAEAEPEEVPPFFDVHCVMRLAWWMITGETPQIGRKLPALDASLYPQINKAWLEGLQTALDPTYPVPPQTIAALRDLLTGNYTKVTAAESGEQVSSAPPKLECTISDVKLVKVSSDYFAQGTLYIKNAGGGVLKGYSRSTQRWARVIPNTFEGNDTDVVFWIDPSGLEASSEHHAHIYLCTQNQELDIPVEVKTARHWLSVLPISVAAVFQVLPGMLCALADDLTIDNAGNRALEDLTQLNRGPIPLEGVLHDKLPEQLIKMPLNTGDSALANAGIVGALLAMSFALIPFLCHWIYKHYPEEQAKKLQWLQLIAMFLPSVFFLLNWNSPLLSPIAAQHPQFATSLDFKGFFPTLLLLNVIWTLLMSHYTRGLIISKLKEQGTKIHSLLVQLAIMYTIYVAFASVFGLR